MRAHSMRKYKAIRTMWDCTKVTMIKCVFSSRPRNVSVASWLLLLVLVLAQPLWLRGQEVPAATETQSDVLAAASFPDLGSSLNGSAGPHGTVALDGSLRPALPGGMAPVVMVTIPTPAKTTHPFWDRQNRTLFAVNGVMAGADFFVTRRNLGNKGKELNPVARMFSGSTPALATNFALETGGVIGISYLLHKTGHHKLERVTSYVNLGASAFAVSYGLAHH